jgi:hypothetical protein
LTADEWYQQSPAYRITEPNEFHDFETFWNFFAEIEFKNFFQPADAPKRTPWLERQVVVGYNDAEFTDEKSTVFTDFTKQNEPGWDRKRPQNANNLWMDKNRKCLLDLSVTSYCNSEGATGCPAGFVAKGNDAPLEGECDGKSVIAFQGTKQASDAILDFKAGYDGFVAGYESVTPWDKSKKYDVCTGHSLGGGIALRAALNGNCKIVATFGAAVSMDIPEDLNISVNSYIHITPSFGCCERDAFGKCTGGGVFHMDPIPALSNAKIPNPILVPESAPKKCSNFPLFFSVLQPSLGSLHSSPPYLDEMNVDLSKEFLPDFDVNNDYGFGDAFDWEKWNEEHPE